SHAILIRSSQFCSFSSMRWLCSASRVAVKLSCEAAISPFRRLTSSRRVVFSLSALSRVLRSAWESINSQHCL
uniref:Uncharacterized protein n=1 Tax=Chenopodium quinoa TaxID=63459 RepID=A0A803MYP6_CHEQI